MHYLSTAHDWSSPEQFHIVSKIIRSVLGVGAFGSLSVETDYSGRDTQEAPFEVYDAIMNRFVRLRLVLWSLAADNPMASEICGHIGSRGNRFCRKCLVGGSKEEKRSDDIYHTLFEAGHSRSNRVVKCAIGHQIAVYAVKGSRAMEEEHRVSGVKWSIPQHVLDHFHDEASRLQIDNIGEVARHVHDSLVQRPDLAESAFPASAQDACFDGSRDSPVEILHTILLGIVKYIWSETHKSFASRANQNKKDTFFRRLEQANLKGTNLSKLQPSYLLQHGGGLQGPEFRSLIQLAAFQLKGCVDDDLWELWKAAGVLAALVWMPSVKNQGAYLVSLRTKVIYKVC